MSSQVEIKVKSRKSLEESIKTRKEGNKLYASKDHNRRMHLDILGLYNKSAALAENDSEEMALAISNRSVLLMHLHHYQESLNDIEKSYQMTKSDEFKIKLLTRKMKCLTLRDQSIENEYLNNRQESKVPLIKKVSKTIQCAADCVSIKYNQIYGRFIIATEDIEIGTIIAKEKAPVLLPNEDKIFTNCSHCLMLACNGIPCNSCANVIYCSEKCKEDAWLQYHDVECSVLPYLDYEYCKHLIFTVRLVIKFIKKEGLRNIIEGITKIKTDNSNDEFINGFFENGIFQSEKFQSFYNLSHNVEKNVLEKIHLQFIPIIKDILQILSVKTNIFNDYGQFLNDNNKALLDFLENEIYKLKLTVDQNTYAFQDISHIESISNDSNSDDKKTGIIMTSFCSLFNHSCDQNTGISFTKNQEIVIYAIKFIKKGEQIFTNYGTPLEMEKKLRQKKLKTYYNFICKCEPCENNWPTDFTQLFDRINVDELIFKFIKSDITKSAFRVFVGNFEEDVFNGTILKQAIKMCHIIHKTYNFKEASICTAKMKSYFHIYYDKIYSIRSLSIFDSC